MSATITPITMPKWGLSMSEGTVVAWLVDEGAEVRSGMPLLEVETDKINNEIEAAEAGILRRKVAQEGALLPVKALLGVLAPAEVGDAEIDAYVAAYVAPATEDDQGGAAADAYQFVDVAGLRVRYAGRGDLRNGVPVLFIHGFGGDLDNWLFNIDAAGELLPTLALDLPAHGQSAVRLPGATLADLSAFVLAFLDALGVDRVHLVGHSLGGTIAASMARAAAKRVASLTLIASAGLGDEIDADYLGGFVAASSRRELKPVMERLFADASLVSRQLLDDVLRFKRLDGVGAALTDLAAGLFAGGRQSDQPGRGIADSGIPVQVIWGSADRIIPSRHATAAGAAAKVHVLDGAGHMVQMERAREVNALLVEHLRSSA
jgi:pyruvate dehydrogenase E2 component (dihydrolipoamide acetyltransferase)